jgi:hypothetical protein
MASPPAISNKELKACQTKKDQQWGTQDDPACDEPPFFTPVSALHLLDDFGGRLLNQSGVRLLEFRVIPSRSELVNIHNARCLKDTAA